MPEFTKSQTRAIVAQLSDEDLNQIHHLIDFRKQTAKGIFEEYLRRDDSADSHERRAALFNRALLDAAFERPERLALLPPPIDVQKLWESNYAYDAKIFFDSLKLQTSLGLRRDYDVSFSHRVEKGIERATDWIRSKFENPLPSESIITAKLEQLTRQIQDISERSGIAKEDQFIRVLANQRTEIKQSWTQDLFEGKISAKVVDSYYLSRIDQANRISQDFRQAFPHLANETPTIDPTDIRREVVADLQHLREHAQFARYRHEAETRSKGPEVRQSAGLGYEGTRMQPTPRQTLKTRIFPDAACAATLASRHATPYQVDDGLLVHFMGLTRFW